MENELEIEQRRAREYAANNRKIERQYNEIRIQIEDEIRVKTELADANNTLANKVRTLRRQLEEAVRISYLFTIKTHSHREKWKRKRKFSLIFVVYCLIYLLLSLSTFTWCGQASKRGFEVVKVSTTVIFAEIYITDCF